MKKPITKEILKYHMKDNIPVFLYIIFVLVSLVLEGGVPRSARTILGIPLAILMLCGAYYRIRLELNDSNDIGDENEETDEN